jgi:hypothetical protein
VIVLVISCLLCFNFYGSLTREIDKCWIKFLVGIHQELFDNDRFIHENLKEVFVFDSVVSGYENVEEVRFRIELERWDLFVP